MKWSFITLATLGVLIISAPAHAEDRAAPTASTAPSQGASTATTMQETAPAPAPAPAQNPTSSVGQKSAPSVVPPTPAPSPQATTQPTADGIVPGPTPLSQQAPKAPQETYERRHRRGRRLLFYVGAGFNTASKITFSTATATQGDQAYGGAASFNVGEAFSLQTGVAFIPEHSWGFEGGIVIEQPRAINSAAVPSSSAGQTVAVTYTGSPTFQFSIIEVSAVYRWGFLYVPFGLNMSFVNYSLGSGSSSNVFNPIGSFGAQAGLGFYVSDHFQVEILSRTIGMEANGLNDFDLVKYGYGSLPGLEAIARFSF